MNLYSNETEQALLGSCLIDPDAFAEAREIVHPDDFYLERHKLIFEALQRVTDGGEPVDILTVSHSLNGTSEAVGGQAYLSTLINVVPSAVHALSYARTVARFAWLRRYVNMSAEAVKRAHDGEDPLSLFGWANDALSRLTPTSADDGHILAGPAVTPFYNALIEDRIERRQKGEQALLWPWASWNQKGHVRPPRPGEISLFIAADGAGKTTYLNMIGEKWAQQGMKTLIVHLENGHSDLLDRRACRWAGVPLDDLEDGTITERQRAELDRVQWQIDGSWGANLHYSHCPGYTVRQIINDVETLRRKGECAAVVIDYFDKMTPDPDLAQLYRDDNRREAAMMERLKTYAEKTGLIVLTASQLTKYGKAAGARANRNDMRGSGEKSDKCQQVLVLFRERSENGIKDAYGNVICKPGQYSPHAAITIDKQNRGGTGALPMQWFDGPRHRVLDPTQERRP